MEILVERKWKKPNYTVGNLYINGKWIANTLEDVDYIVNSIKEVVEGLRMMSPLYEEVLNK